MERSTLSGLLESAKKGIELVEQFKNSSNLLIENLHKIVDTIQFSTKPEITKIAALDIVVEAEAIFLKNFTIMSGELISVRDKLKKLLRELEIAEKN